MESDDKPAESVDCVGTYCPVPLFRAKEGMDRIEAGQVLEIISDDPAAEEDLKSFARRAGHEIVGFEKNEGILRFLIRKGK